VVQLAQALALQLEGDETQRDGERLVAGHDPLDAGDPPAGHGDTDHSDREDGQGTQQDLEPVVSHAPLRGDQTMFQPETSKRNRKFHPRRPGA
jgi:hypothetical protein